MSNAINLAAKWGVLSEYSEDLVAEYTRKSSATAYVKKYGGRIIRLEALTIADTGSAPWQ